MKAKSIVIHGEKVITFFKKKKIITPSGICKASSNSGAATYQLPTPASWFSPIKWDYVL
jgi:hypothetical protein